MPQTFSVSFLEAEELRSKSNLSRSKSVCNLTEVGIKINKTYSIASFSCTHLLVVSSVRQRVGIEVQTTCIM